MENRNFPYILLGRALYYTQKVSKRSHAKRGEMELEMDNSFKSLWLEDELKKTLEGYHKKFRSGKEVPSEVLKEYALVLRGVLEKLAQV